MSKRKGIFVSCNEAALCCDKSQYKEASLAEKIRLNIHLIFCKACRLYSSRNSRLTWLLKHIETEELSEDDKRIMKQNLEKQMSD
ncbi:hypothetical protein [Aquimarina intermedia]|uniref:Uncharacterized protein n=1 Tax=Aquimarina intermedia TaxID=350814 RepID=A0A5S5C2C3_9FLAO|nr:hypothetical protein [Aquimarina intermedia]TYP73447.1 hypothetical protein BD809_10534 [Aquimarina intermedia]